MSCLKFNYRQDKDNITNDLAKLKRFNCKILLVNHRRAIIKLLALLCNCSTNTNN